MTDASAGAGPHNAVQLELRWSDSDPYGHTNNVALLRLIEEARIRLFGLPDKPKIASAVRAEPLLSVLGANTLTMVVAQRVQYTRELSYSGQVVTVEGWLSHIGSRSMVMDFRLTDTSADAECLTARITIVVMDLLSRRPRDITPTERAALEPHMAPGINFR